MSLYSDYPAFKEVNGQAIGILALAIQGQVSEESSLRRSIGRGRTDNVSIEIIQGCVWIENGRGVVGLVPQDASS